MSRAFSVFSPNRKVFSSYKMGPIYWWNRNGDNSEKKRREEILRKVYRREVHGVRRKRTTVANLKQSFTLQTPFPVVKGAHAQRWLIRVFSNAKESSFAAFHINFSPEVSTVWGKITEISTT